MSSYYVHFPPSHPCVWWTAPRKGCTRGDDTIVRDPGRQLCICAWITRLQAALTRTGVRGARLELGDVELELGGLAGAVAAGEGARAPGAAAAHRLVAEQLRALRAARARPGPQPGGARAQPRDSNATRMRQARLRSGGRDGGRGRT